MRAGTNSRGYTVVEVMIFMAISGLMFVLAASFISNKQAKAEFRQSMNSLNSKIAQTINDVGNGYFPDRGGFSCEAVSGSINISVLGNKSQGTNLGCVFIGKIIELGISGDAAGGYTGYRVYTVAGRQYVTTADKGVTPTTFADASPKVVDPLTETTERFEWGMRMTKLVNNTQNINAIGFFTSFGQYNNGLHQASNSTVVVPMVGAPTLFNKAATSGFDSSVVSAPNITMCFESGRGQYGTLTIGSGGSGQRLATKVQTYESKPGVC